MDAPTRDESLGSVLVALAANLAVAAAKGTAAAPTGSPALFAETLHTVADASNEVLLYIAIRRSRHPPDASHPFGYGPERYYWALLAAIGMFVVGGAVSIWDGILGSIVIGGLLCFLASRLTTRNHALLTNQSVPDRYVRRLRARIEAETTIRAVTQLEAVYLGPAEVLAAADVEMSDGLTGREVAAALAQLRADLRRDIPAIARLYLTPVLPPR